MESSAQENKNRILVIDDDTELCELLKDYLKLEGFEVEAVNNAEAGAQRALSGEHALVVLDVMLPGISGFEVLRRIRERSGIPVLMLTARGDDVDRIVGLEMGADDYLPKPFNPRELVARIRAVKRRARPEVGKAGPEAARAGTDSMTVGDIFLDRASRRVLRSGGNIELTAVEFNLLEELLLSAGQLVSREDLYKKVLGHGLSPYDRSIDVHVSNLRKKLGRDAHGMERIKTVRGMGYLYTRPQDLPAEKSESPSSREGA
ncbi:MAG: response regulator transcription factor [Nitrospiraceae bacterium]|nr:response regulator transcription factor [Nitrospiraceae bacterium]MDA8089702.1 response regulator transcription factor [Nitrospiraceae bacterium]